MHPLPILLLASVLAACSASQSEPTETSSPTPPSETPSEPATTAVGVVVVTVNVLGQSCEALTGIKRGLHNGARVVIESSTGEVVGTGRLGDPPKRAPKGLCAWGAEVQATLVPGEAYLARAAVRFTSEPLGEAQIQQGRPLVIETD